MSKGDKKMPASINREPADMHSDGVHFNEELLARKRKKELEKKKIDKARKK